MACYYLLIALCCYALPLYAIIEKPNKNGTSDKKTIIADKPITLKSLTHDYGVRVALMLYTLNKEKITFKEIEYPQKLTQKEKLALISALWHPSQIGYAMIALLPPELSNHIAYFIYKSSPTLHYRALQPIQHDTLNNARILSFNPFNSHEILFTSDNLVKKLYKNNIITISDSANNSKITKMVYHPHDNNVFIMNRDKNLTIYENGRFTIWDGVKIKDFTFSSSQNQLLVYPENSIHFKKSLLFDLNEKKYSESKKTTIITSPDVTHVTSNPDNNLIADVNTRTVRISDLNTDTMKTAIKINRNHGKCLFDPHNPNIIAYISGRFLRIIDVNNKQQCAVLTHKSPIIDFDFNPSQPYDVLVTQKNGETIEWKQSLKKINNISLMQMMRFLKKGIIPT